MNWKDKTILVVGGTGSFGQNFIKLLNDKYKPKAIRVYSRDEHKQTQLLNTYAGVGSGNNLSGFIGDIRDKDRLKRAMEGADLVVHCAALKQVQSCEYNPFETIKTNIIGSMNVIDCALDNNVEKVIAISTDKAVSPLNLYGATKMCMEKIFINANNYRGKNKRTKFCCTRYGNVVASRGTVVPIWRQQLKNNEPLAVTNWQATRYWINMAHANNFVKECIELMDNLDGGEIFVPKIPSVKLTELFKAMSSLNTKFKIIGDRVGDKLHEILILDNEVKHTVDIGDKFIIYPESPQWKYNIPKGDKCAYRGGYSSDNNKEFLNIGQIKKSLEENQ